MRKLVFEIDGKQVEGTVAYSRGILWVHMKGQTFTWEAPKRSGRRGGKASALANPGEVAAPMPGKIIKISVKPGEKVASGQVLLVMEAMKMEYTLKSQVEGTVSEIACTPGQQVALGQVLAKLEI